eukprot:3838519-Prymnesium_polylepis.1
MASTVPEGKVPELKELLAAIGMAVVGTKPNLVERLVKSFAEHKDAETNLDEETQGQADDWPLIGKWGAGVSSTTSRRAEPTSSCAPSASACARCGSPPGPGPARR